MDKILEGTLNSNHPEELQKALCEKIAQSAATIIDESIIFNILDCCTRTILSNQSNFHITMTKRILNAFTRAHCEVTGKFFLVKLQNLVETGFFSNVRNFGDKKRLFELLSHILSIIKTAGNFVTSNTLMEKVISFFLEEKSVEICAVLAETSIRNWNRDSIETRESELIAKIINLLKMFTLKVDLRSVESPVLEITKRVYQVNLISNFFSKIISVDKRHINFALGEIFNVLSQDKNPSSVTLTPLLTSIPAEYAEFGAETICTHAKIKDKNIEIALCKLIDWLAWPGSQSLDIWIITLFKKLIADGNRNHLVTGVIKKKAIVIFNHMFSQESRKCALPVFLYMMLIYQHSPDIFHKIAPRIPSLIDMVKASGGNTETDGTLKTLSELIYTLMYLFPGYPDVYSKLKASIKEYPAPSEVDMKRWLTENHIFEPDHSTSLKYVEPLKKQIKGKTGLTNLGNTCYMNSVIQALFMLKSFRSRLFSMTLTERNDPLTYNLTKLFAFLLLSERTAISPNDFYRISRPPWFRPGAQQDCSEFLKFLIERMEQEDKSRHSREAPSTENGSGIHELFTGECRVDVKCLNCGFVSSRFEAFNDIPLAFADTVEEGKRPSTLKGGDVSRGLHSRVKASDSLNDAKDVLEANSVNPVTQSQSAAMNPSHAERHVSAMTSGQHKEQSLQLQELLDSYLSTESLHGQNQYRCDNCASLQDAEQQHLFTSCPKFLVLTLKRFTYDIKTHQRGKIMQNVKFPSELTVPFLIGSKNSINTDIESEKTVLESSVPMDLEEPLEQQESLNRSSCGFETDLACAAKPVLKVIAEEHKTYSLVAVIIHSGVSSESGHYYCYCRKNISTEKLDSAKTFDDGEFDSLKNMDFNSLHGRDKLEFKMAENVSNIESSESRRTKSMISGDENKWYLFNDSLVTAVKTQDLEKIQTDHPRDTPYVFIYEETGTADVTNDEIVQPEFSLLIEADNREYLKDHRNAKRPLNNFSWQSKSRKWDKDNDDDKSDGGSSGNCGDGFGGFNMNAGRFIY